MSAEALIEWNKWFSDQNQYVDDFHVNGWRSLVIMWMKNRMGVARIKNQKKNPKNKSNRKNKAKSKKKSRGRNKKRRMRHHQISDSLVFLYQIVHILYGKNVYVHTTYRKLVHMLYGQNVFIHTTYGQVVYMWYGQVVYIVTIILWAKPDGSHAV